MATLPNDFQQQIREQRSSESNFDSLLQLLDKAIDWAAKNQQSALNTDLQETKEKYAVAYTKAKETGGTAWPEFEKFVTQFERALMEVNDH